MIKVSCKLSIRLVTYINNLPTWHAAELCLGTVTLDRNFAEVFSFQSLW